MDLGESPTSIGKDSKKIPYPSNNKSLESEEEILVTVVK